MDTSPSQQTAPSAGRAGPGSTSLAASSAAASVSSERNARTARAAETAPKPRSCVTCRSRKVRCDKKSPCSNCRRAQIACVLPSDDKPPRWARRLERLNAGAAASSTTTATGPPDAGASQVMNRLQNLENLVKNLSAELQQARSTRDASMNSSVSPSSMQNWPHEAPQTSSPASTGSNPQAKSQAGRLIPGSSGQSQYVSSGFWSRISDEVSVLHGISV